MYSFSPEISPIAAMTACCLGTMVSNHDLHIVVVLRLSARCKENGRIKMRNILADLFGNKTFAFNGVVSDFFVC